MISTLSSFQGTQAARMACTLPASVLGFSTVLPQQGVEQSKTLPIPSPHRHVAARNDCDRAIEHNMV